MHMSHYSGKGRGAAATVWRIVPDLPGGLALGLVGACVLGLLLLGGCASGRDGAVHPEIGAHVGAEAGPAVSPEDSAPAQGPEQGGRAALASADAAFDDDLAFEDYDDEESESISDPLEGWNRFWFGFNDVLLLRIAKPVYTGYTRVVPREFRAGLSNFFYNLQMPVRFVNNVLQGKIPQAVVELGRFIVNTTAGMGGFIDITKRNKVLVPMDPQGADFGQTLAHWGVGEGIYLVWPVFGPSTVRDTVGSIGDLAASPLWWAAEPVGPVDFWPVLATGAGLRFNDIGSTIDAYEAVTKGAVEPYVAARDAYVKYRRALIRRGAVQPR